MNNRYNSPIVGILGGPTASGKSAMAVQIAEIHDLAIVSADSMQVYRGMEIGTGVIPEGERQNVPHFLLGVAEPGEDYHAARFVEETRRITEHQWQEHGRRSLVVGGTGMWIQALREGLFEGPGRDEAIRSELREILHKEGNEALHGELMKVDPSLAERLSPRDHVRVLRAIEVFRLTGRPLSEWYARDEERRAALEDLIPLVVMTHERQELHRRIEIRVDEMLENGWLGEAQALHRMELPDHAPAKKALGYRELFRVIDGTETMEEAREKIKVTTRQYAKRQLTWFRAQREVVMLTSPTAGDIEAALGLDRG